MTEDDLLWLATKACYSYFDLYRRFPLRVGMHPYWRSLRWTNLRFPLPTQPRRYLTQQDMQKPIEVETQTVSLVVYLHPDVQPNHVWLYHPDATDWVPSDLVFTLAGVPMEDRQRSIQGAD